MGVDALGRVATLAYPARVVEPGTADLSARALAADSLTPAVRRSVVDADSELREALRSLHERGARATLEALAGPA